jgi:hypothetical protein
MIMAIGSILISQQLISILQVYASNSQSSSGGTDWWKLCQQAHTFLGLQTPCDELVNSDNTLTPLGDKVLYCYAGGALLGLLGGLEALGPGKALGDKAGCPK